MDKIRPRKKLTSNVAPTSSSGHLLISPHHQKENQRTGKQNSSPVSGSDFGSRSCGASEDIKLFDQGKITSSLPLGIPMKKLLADEMSKETESKRRSPSVIARLMGLDGLPSQQNCNKQRQKNSVDHHQDAGSNGFRQSSKHYDGQSRRKNAKGKQQFKDVYEVAEGSNIHTRNYSSHAPFNRNPRVDEMAFIRQKFMDVKRLSTDEKLRNSKEFHDALEVLDSNKDILLKFLQEPDILFLKHLYEVHGAPESHWEHFPKLQSANTLKCSIDAVEQQSGREASLNSSDFFGYLYHRRNINLPKSYLLAEDKEVATSVPTRIVILKPNLVKVHGTSKRVIPSCPSYVQVSNADLHVECSSTMHVESAMRCNFNDLCKLDINDSGARESRELAREVTRRMRNNLGIDSFNISSLGNYGYSADESGHDMSENESSYDSEVTIVDSQFSFSRDTLNKHSASLFLESSVNREAKRRLSERWKMTRRSHLIGASGKGNTLGEMLAISDVDTRPQSSNAVVVQEECFQRIGNQSRTAQSMPPLGISSRDGWKEGRVQNSSRSRPLPTLSNHLGNPKSSRSHEAVERLLARKRSFGHLIDLSIKKDSERKEVPFTGSTIPNFRKAKHSYLASTEIISDAQEIHSSRGMMSKSLDELDSCRIKGGVVDMSSRRQDATSALHTVADKENTVVSESESYRDQQVRAPGIPSSVLSQDNSSACDLPFVEQEPSTNSYASGSSCLLSAATQPESPVSSKESEQPSPVSVLETPFVEELSSGSECFERVSAELHGLRMQLHLLKLESEAYDGGSAIVSSDEDVDLSNKMAECKGFHRVGESCESSYLVDVLAASKLNSDPEFFHATWHSSDCPIAFRVFENLEKKYSAWETCLKSDRKLLFDRINYRIIEISQQLIDLYPWVKQQRRNVATQWWKDNWLETELQKLVESRENQISSNATDAVILDSMPWLELDVHVDSIGRFIEELLMDELVEELLPL